MRDILADLNEQQRQVAQTVLGPLLVLAGAGSGKTKALTHRIAYLIAEGIAKPHHIMAVTFTNKAAREMRERIYNLIGNSHHTPRAVGTFHGLGARMLREQSTAHPRSEHFVILDTNDSERLARQALKEENVSLRDWSPRQIRARISSAKNSLVTPADAALDITGPADEIFAKAYARYEELLASNDAYDFDDLLLQTHRLLKKHSSIRQAYQMRWRFISVDEYQDTNPLQNEILQLLLGTEQNICAVGDDYQSIYSWRGAKVDHILQFEAEFPHCTTIYLTQNYRSTPQILEAANAVIAANTSQKHKTLWTQNPTGTSVRLIALQSDRYEAGWVRQQIAASMREGKQLKDIVVLYRTNAQSRLLEEEFLTHRIPYSIVGGFRFYDRREVKDSLAFLHFWVNPNSRLSLERIANALLDRVGPKTIQSWEKKAVNSNISLLQVLEQEVEKRPNLRPFLTAYAATRSQTFEHVSDLLRYLIEKSGYIKILKEEEDDWEERLENIEELFNVTAAYTDVHAFLEDAALLSEMDTLDTFQDRVTCMTLHASKGLEFDAVFLVGCEEGLLPHINSIDSSASIEEERRLMYVGMTRARKQLTVTYAHQRYVAGEITMQLPSRFLEQLPPQVEQVDTAASVPMATPTSAYQHNWTLPQPEAASSPPTEPILISVSEGEFIAHPAFGRGVVISISGSLVTCVFETHGVKTIDAQSIQS